VGTEETEERWTYGSSINLLWPEIVRSLNLDSSAGLYFRLHPFFFNFVRAAIPAPDGTKGWQVKSVMLRYKISAPFTEFGFGGIIDSIKIMDGERRLWDSGSVSYGLTIGFETLKLELSEPKSFNYGLGVYIGVGYYWVYGMPLYSTFYFPSVGLEFVRGGVGPVNPFP
jgi:hypothetical protein